MTLQLDHPATTPESGADVLPTEDSREILAVKNLSKTFHRANGSTVPAIDGVSLSVNAGEFLVLLGPSGCGKTTLLRTIAGLEMPDSGEIEIDGRTVFSSTERIELSAQHRELSMVFQSYALWPNMTVFENIAYPLQNKRGNKKTDIREQVERVCKLVGISEVIGQYPNHISGGQQQRVALARALVSGNALVLFDEPLSNVDAKVRKDLRVELTALQAKFGFAAVYVTHDQEDAMELGHKIAVLQEGRVAQLDSPVNVYERPASRYVATFIGSTNEITGRVTAIDGDTVVIDSSMGVVHGRQVSSDLAVGDEAVAIFRPENARVVSDEPSGANRWKATYRASLFSGTHVEQVVTHDRKPYRVWGNGLHVSPGDGVWITADPSSVHVFTP